MMRFMVLVKADKDSQAGVLPTKQLIADMGRSTRRWSRPG